MAKDLSAPEAFALAKLAASDGRADAPAVVSLVESQLAGHPRAQEALESARSNPDDPSAIASLAGHVRKYGRGKSFRAQVRTDLGSRKNVAAIGIAQLTAMTETEGDQNPPKVARLVENRIADDPEAQEALDLARQAPDDLGRASTLAEHIRANIRNVRSAPGFPAALAWPADFPGVTRQFLNVLEDEAAGVIVEPEAKRLIGKALRNGTEGVRAIPGQQRSAYIAESSERLRDVAASTVRQIGPTPVDAESLDSLLQSSCPFPPFWY
jgi:hypothetical protein